MATVNGALVRATVEAGFTNPLTVQQPFAAANVERLRRVHPDAAAHELVRLLDRYFLTAVTTSGSGAGAAGAIPGVGIPAALADVLAFTEAATLYVLSLAEIHGLHPEDIERRRLLVQTVLIGDSAVNALGKVTDKAGKHWAKVIVEKIPMAAIDKANKVLGPRFITKYGTKQGTLVLSKQMPLGIGIVLGGGANHLVGRGVIASARKIFGPVPATGSEAGDEPGEVAGIIEPVAE